MTMSDFITYLLIWGALGAVLFSLFVVFVFRTGMVYLGREKSGLLKNRIPLAGIMLMGALLSAIVIFMVSANRLGMFEKGLDPSLFELFSANLCLFAVLVVYDTLVIDWLVLGVWRPGFLKLNDNLARASIRKHMIESIPVGVTFGLCISGIVSGISYWMSGQ